MVKPGMSELKLPSPWLSLLNILNIKITTVVEPGMWEFKTPIWLSVLDIKICL